MLLTVLPIKNSTTKSPPTPPEFQPEKFVVSKEKYDITGNKLMDDDDDVPGNEYTATNENPYVDGVKTTNQKT